MKKTFLFVFIFAMMFVVIGSVSATHTASVTLSPNGWLKPNTSAIQFNFTVTNVNAVNGISQVIVTIPNDGFGNLICNPVSDWGVTSSLTSCQYDASSQNEIAQGDSKTFYVSMKTGDYGKYNLTVKTKEVGDTSLVTNIVPVQVQSVYFKPQQSCEPNWECSAWNACANGYMNRNCYDSNHCSFEYNKPVETAACDNGQQTLAKVQNSLILPSLLSFGLAPIFIVVLLIVVFALRKK